MLFSLLTRGGSPRKLQHRLAHTDTDRGYAVTDSIETFFNAWQLESDAERSDAIHRAVTEDVLYVDPRTPEPIRGREALSEYVGMFSKNAPGWSASVVASDSVGGVTRATVAFGGPGPDGTTQSQLGQYFVESDGTSISRMTGFVGVGAPDT